jgi:hypothetical protein
VAWRGVKTLESRVYQKSYRAQRAPALDLLSGVLDIEEDAITGAS